MTTDVKRLDRISLRHVNHDSIVLEDRQVVDLVDVNTPLRGEVCLVPVVLKRHAPSVCDEDCPQPLQTDVVDVEVLAELPGDEVSQGGVEAYRPHSKISARGPAIVSSLGSVTALQSMLRYLRIRFLLITC